MSRAERRYRAEKIARKRWIYFHQRVPRWLGFFQYGGDYRGPEVGLYRKWNGSHGKCQCGTIRKHYKHQTNIRIRKFSGDIPSGGYYKRMQSH